MGSVSAAMTTNSEIPRLSVLVAAKQTSAQHKCCCKSLWVAQTAVLEPQSTLIGALPQLLVICRLLHYVQDGVRQLVARTLQR